MLWGMNGHVAKPRVEAQSPEWKKLYVGEARQNGMKVMIVEVSVLEKLIKQDAQMPELNSQGRTMIDGIEYQRV